MSTANVDYIPTKTPLTPHSARGAKGGRQGRVTRRRAREALEWVLKTYADPVRRAVRKAERQAAR